MSNSDKINKAIEQLNVVIEQLSSISDDAPSDALFDVIISLESNYDELSDIANNLS